MSKGMQAYWNNQTAYEKSTLNEPDLLIDELLDKAKLEALPLEEKSTLKHIVDNDLRSSVPPQLFSAMSGILKLMETVEESEGPTSE